LTTLYTKSGKNNNDIGDYEGCIVLDDFDYVLINFEITQYKMVGARIGLWSPKHCNTPENYSSITDMLKTFAESTAKLEMNVFIEKPVETSDIKLSAGAISMICLISLVLLLWILGIVVEYTSLGDKRNYENDLPAKIEDRKTKVALFLYSFNPIFNLNKLVTVKEGGDQRLAVLNGVRVLSIWWVIVGHGFSFVQFAPVMNMGTMGLIFNNTLFGIVPGGFYAVDSFFFLSGFLTFYLLSIKMYPKKGWVNFGLIYFHRYFRLIFPIVFVTGFSMFLIKYLGTGPYYVRNWDVLNRTWETYWWNNFLFINNLYPWDMGKNCIGWVWYLANDFQFFLISPPIIFAYCKQRRIGYILVFFLILSSMLINLSLSWHYDLSVTLTSGKTNGMNIMYSKPWSRMGAYFVGALFGFSYFEYEKQDKHPELKDSTSSRIYWKFKTSRIASLISFIVGVGLTALYVFPLGKYYYDWGAENGDDSCWALFPSVLYNATSRPFFVFGLGLIVAPTFVGRLRVIKNFLGAEFFAVLARLNYMVYMIHWLVLFWYLNGSRQAFYINWLNQWFTSIGAMIISFIFAVPFTLLWEVPFMNLEKYILFPAKMKAKPQPRPILLKENSDIPSSVFGGSNGKSPKYFPLSDEEKTVDSQEQLLNKENSS
jgi:peptidoglycan/LPS O-acetylase OafA/YrhL